MTSSKSPSLGKRLRRDLRDAVIRLPLLPALWLLRRFARLRCVRLGRLRATRIGHFCFENDLYLSSRERDSQGRGALDFFCLDGPVCNETLLTLFRRRMRIGRWVKRLFTLNQGLADAAAHEARIPGRDDVPTPRDVLDVIDNTPPPVAFTEKELALGRRELVALGIPDGAKYVCLHGRDAAYLNQAFPEHDWSHHAYRDFPIQDFLPAVDAFVDLGYYVVRVGHGVHEPLEHPSPRVIDYALHSRSDFLDVFLPAHCEFFLGNTSGLFYVATLFRRPVLAVNVAPIESLGAFCSNDLVLLKPMHDAAGGAALTLNETIDRGVAAAYTQDVFDAAGVRVGRNQPSEIRDAALEMHARTSGKFQPCPSNEHRQQTVRDRLTDGGVLGPFRAPIAEAGLSSMPDFAETLGGGADAA